MMSNQFLAAENKQDWTRTTAAENEYLEAASNDDVNWNSSVQLRQVGGKKALLWGCLLGLKMCLNGILLSNKFYL